MAHILTRMETHSLVHFAKVVGSKIWNDSLSNHSVVLEPMKFVSS
jgi:hypothetical protein